MVGLLALPLPMQTILVVDDSPENLQVISAVLKEHYKVKVAINGERALALATAAEPPRTRAAQPTRSSLRIRSLSVGPITVGARGKVKAPSSRPNRGDAASRR